MTLKLKVFFTLKNLKMFWKVADFIDLDPAWIQIRIYQILWIRIRIQSIWIHITAILSANVSSSWNSRLPHSGVSASLTTGAGKSCSMLDKIMHCPAVHKPVGLVYMYIVQSCFKYTLYRCTALELAPKQIRVNSVNPGLKHNIFYLI